MRKLALWAIVACTSTALWAEYPSPKECSRFRQDSLPKTGTRLGPENFQSSCLKPAGTWPYGACATVGASSQNALFGNGTVVQLVDLSNPTMPTVVGEVALPDQPQEIAVVGTLVYVADGWGGLQIVDASNPQSPVIAGNLDVHAFCSDVKVAGGLAYLSSGDLHVIDVSIPAHPREIGILLGAYSPRIALSGTFAYGVGSGSVLVIDLTIPARPLIRSMCNLPVASQASETDSQIVDIAVSGSIAYVAYSKGLMTIDISNPDSPRILGSVDLPGWGRSVVVKDNIAFVADGHEGIYGLYVIDVSNPAMPTIVGDLPPLGEPRDVAFFQDKLLMADWVGLRILDITNPAMPVQLGVLEGPGEARTLAVEGTHAYVATAHASSLWILDASLMVFDLANPTNPVPRGSVSLPVTPYRCAAMNNIVYVAGGPAGLMVFDASDDLHPVQVGYLSTGGSVYDLAIQGRYAYLADTAGVKVADIQDPTNPVLIGSFGNETNVIGFVAADGNLVYYVDGYALDVLNVADPTHPLLLGSSPFSGWDTTRIAEADGVVYIATFMWGIILAYDVHNPANILYIGGTTDINGPSDILLRGSMAYVSDADSGLVALDVSNPGAPKLVGNMITNGAAAGLGSIGQNIVMADGYNGLTFADPSACGATCGFLAVPQSNPQTGGVAPIAVDFSSGTQQTGCSGSPTFSWNFGDGASSSEVNPTHAYTKPGDYYWDLATSLEGQACVSGGVLCITPTPPTIKTAKGFSNPFRIKISGSKFQRGLLVTINGLIWPNVSWKSKKSVILTGDSALEARCPKGTTVPIQIVNPDGGSATVEFTNSLP